MEESDLDISLDSVVYNTVDNFMNDIGVEVNFGDSAYESEIDYSTKPTNDGNSDSSSTPESADTQTKFGVDLSIDFSEIPFSLSSSAGHNSAYLPIKVDGFTVNALIDTGSQATVVSEKLADILNLMSEDSVYVRGATTDTSVKARVCHDITFQIEHMTYKWHVLIAPIEDDLILGLDFLLHYKIDILFSDGVISIGNSYTNSHSTQANYSSDNTFELNKLTVNQTIKVKPWSAKFVKIPINCKFGNWKIFESRYFDNIFIPIRFST